MVLTALLHQCMEYKLDFILGAFPSKHGTRQVWDVISLGCKMVLNQA